MMNIILRRSSSLLVPRRGLSLSLSLSCTAALGSTESLLKHHVSGEKGGVSENHGWKMMGLGYLGRNFHVKSGPLDFKASTVLGAESAVDHYVVDDDKDKEEGLEISKLGICEEIVSALSRRGIVKLFPIQRAVLEPAMQGRDMIGRARTGTGKTLAFGIPILDKIIQFNAKHGRGRNPLCLVLAPTRELAKQVEKEFRESAHSLDTICVYGGSPISHQMRTLDYGVDVAVGTPGRIIDLIKRGALNLSEVQFVVLDEADQMLSVGFAEDVETILDNLPQNRQSMMFSATMPPWIRNLTHKYLKNPLTIDLVGESDQKLADGISLYCIASDMYAKASIIGPLITEHAKGGKCIVFTQTKRDADRLAYAMARNYRCEALHGDISQSQRERTLSGFRDGHFNILVATDVAARGLDVPNVDLVIHYELPNTSETFVHRTGRTGRAGKKGSAILIYTHEQARAVRSIERDVGCKFTELPRIAVEGGSGDIFSDMGGSPGTYGGKGDRRYGDMSFGRSGGYRSSSSGRFSEGGEYGAPSSGRFGSYANRSSGLGSSRSGGFGKSDRSVGFGEFGRSARSGGFGEFGRSNRSGRFGEFGRSDHSGGFGEFGRSDRSSRFGDFADKQSSQSGGSFVNSHSSVFGGSGNSGPDDNQNSGRRSF